MNIHRSFDSKPLHTTLVAILITVGLALPLKAQYFADIEAPEVQSVGDTKTCLNPDAPCPLAKALERTRGKRSARIWLRTRGRSGEIYGDFSSAYQVNGNVTLVSYKLRRKRRQRVRGDIHLKGDLELDSGSSLRLHRRVNVNLRNNLRMKSHTRMVGPGFLLFKGYGGTRTIQLGDPAAAPPYSPKTGTIENLGIDMGDGGQVRVRDQAEYDGVTSRLFILNALVVVSGDLDMTTNELHLTANTDGDGFGNAPRTEVYAAGSIVGTDTLYLISCCSK